MDQNARVIVKKPTHIQPNVVMVHYGRKALEISHEYRENAKFKF